MSRVPRRIRRIADRRATAWAADYPNPEAGIETIGRDLRSWLNRVTDELMDVAHDRPIRTLSAIMLVFAGTAFGMTAGQVLGSRGLADALPWVGVGIAVFFVLPAVFLLRPVSTRRLRSRIWSLLQEKALVGLLRRRAFSEPQPQPRPEGVSPREAECLVRDWMAHLGAPEAEVTRFSRDRGVDVIAGSSIAQVKNWVGKVPVSALRDFSGAAQLSPGKRALFFTSGSYTADARAYARSVRMSLFIYRAEQGRLVGANPDGHFTLANGLHVPLPGHQVPGSAFSGVTPGRREPAAVAFR